MENTAKTSSMPAPVTELAIAQQQKLLISEVRKDAALSRGIQSLLDRTLQAGEMNESDIEAALTLTEQLRENLESLALKLAD